MELSHQVRIRKDHLVYFSSRMVKEYECGHCALSKQALADPMMTRGLLFNDNFKLV